MSARSAQLAVITGTTHGIGRVTSRELARAGHRVLMLCRNLPAAQLVREEIRTQVPGAEVDTLGCDLASLASVRECAGHLKRQFGPIGLLINNAGTVSMRHRRSPDGFELTFATNHLGPFLLTALLLPHLAPSARIINVASRIHYRARLELERVSDPRAPYRPGAAYAQSKLANVLHTFALARRLSASAVTANCLHPGVVASHLLPPWLRLVKPILSPEIVDVERGAQCTLHLALANELDGVSGRYFDDQGRAQHAARLANDESLQEQLWSASARWVGLEA
jgi:NAD(P)-dependent dehydrogenase (short-subunit alcohol dehydrogenase family)